MSSEKPNVTAEELELALSRKHDLDNPKFISLVKKAVKAKDVRVNVYEIKRVSDGFMLKINMEKFMGNVSMGHRWVKGYLSETKFPELEKLLDDIPRKQYQDSRDGATLERPRKVVKEVRKKETLLDLDSLWDVDEK